MSEDKIIREMRAELAKRGITDRDEQTAALLVAERILELFSPEISRRATQ